jgi:thymidylate synthase (FAD)
MILVKPSVEIVHYSTNAEQLLEAAGRTCYKSNKEVTYSFSPKFIKSLIARGHESVIEHANATVRFICDRGISHEIVRHRLASYSQESTRYCDYKHGHITFIIPHWIVGLKPGIYDSSYSHLEDSEKDTWINSMLFAEISYRTLRSLGWKPEQARSVLPNSLKTELIMTANFREWRHFFKLRTAQTSHPQMREVAIPLLKEMQVLFPSIFEDIGERLNENII